MKNDKMMKKECPDGNIRREFVQFGTRPFRFRLSTAIAGQSKTRAGNESIGYSSKISNEHGYCFSLVETKCKNAICCKIGTRDDVKRETLSGNVELLEKFKSRGGFFRNVRKITNFLHFDNLLNNSLSNTPYNHDITFKGNVMNNTYPIDIIDSDDMDIKIINPLNGLIVILDALKTTNLTNDQTQSVFSALSALIFNVKEEATIMSADVDGMKEMISLGGVA